MDKSLKQALGIEELDEWMLPGTRPGDAGKVIYVFLPDDADPSREFDRVTSIFDPPIAKNGAAFFDTWLVKTPTGEVFYPVYIHGDVEGWRQEIELGATQLGLKMAKIEGDKFVVSGGPAHRLSDCGVTLDGSPFALPGK
jgi:hypothetical protein